MPPTTPSSAAAPTHKSEMAVPHRIGLGLIKAAAITLAALILAIAVFAAATDSGDDIGDPESGLPFVLLAMFVVATVGPVSLIAFTARARGKTEARPSAGLVAFGALMLAPVTIFFAVLVLEYASDRGLQVVGLLGAVALVAGLGSLVAIAAKFITVRQGLSAAAVFFALVAAAIFGARVNADAHHRATEIDRLEEQQISLFLFSPSNPQDVPGGWEIDRIHHPFSIGVSVNLQDERGSHIFLQFLPVTEPDLCADRTCVVAFELADGTSVRRWVGGDGDLYSVEAPDKRWLVSSRGATTELDIASVLDQLDPVSIDTWMDNAPAFGAPG